MARVVFPDFLLANTGGERELECAAENFRDLLFALEAKWPGLQETLDRCAVAIDGQIYQDAFLEPLQPDSEVFFMQRLEGG
jgi:molybdopterin synthase sulfur carrier subunit